MTVNLSFENEIHQTPINLPRAALQFAREIAYPSLDVDARLLQIDRLAEWARAVVQPDHPVFMQAKDLAEFLFQRFGFRGNREAYEDPRNSYLNEVLDRRLGIPISLSVLYVAVAKKLGLPAFGVGLPGHFIAGVRDALGNAYFDPFHGGRQLSVEDCAALVEATVGLGEGFQMQWLQPAPEAEILARMLNNLKLIYLRGEQWQPAIAVVERLHLLQPEIAYHLRDLGLLHQQAGALRKAVQYFQQYLGLMPDAEDAGVIRQALEAAIQRLARLN